MTDSGRGSHRLARSVRSAAVALAFVVAACSSGGGTAGDGTSVTSDPAPSTSGPPPTTDATPATTGAVATQPSSTTTGPTPPTTPPPPSGEAFATVDPIVAEHIADRGLNGAGLVVVDRDAGIVHEDYWGEFGPDRISLVASSSKMIVAGVLLALDDAGSLDLDAPVADVVEWGEANPDVTPAQLVSNSSGLLGLAAGLRSLPYICQFVATGTLQGCAETVFATSADDSRVIPPDTEFRYGGAQWQVAGAVAEVASGRTWEELLDDTYGACDVDSLGFNNQWTQFGFVDFSYPEQFGADPESLSPTDNPNIEGGAYISPRGYAALLAMLLSDGRCGDVQVLSPESVERMLADRIGEVYGGSDGALGYGLGWFVDRDSGRRIDPGAYGSVAWIDPDLGYAAYLIVEATGDDGNELAAKLFDVVETAVLETRNTLGE